MLSPILKVKGTFIVNIIYYNYVFVFWIWKKTQRSMTAYFIAQTHFNLES